MNFELNAIVMPNGTLQLEWNEVKERIDKNQQLLQNEIHSRFKTDFKSFLLFLSFSDQSIPLSPSLITGDISLLNFQISCAIYPILKLSETT